MHTLKWQYDAQTHEHFLPLDSDRSFKISKTSAGDYAMSMHSDADGFGGEVEYFDVLKKAKAVAMIRALGAAT